MFYKASQKLSCMLFSMISCKYSGWCRSVGSLEDVINGNGDRFYFDGNYIYFKMQDVGEYLSARHLATGNESTVLP